MPRLPQSWADRQQTAVLRAIDAYAAERKRAGQTLETTARTFGFEYQTLNHRRQRPETFTLAELQRIASTLNISLMTLLGEKEVFGGEEHPGA